jgi:hypothetical protein
MTLKQYECKPEFEDVSLNGREGELCHISAQVEMCKRDLLKTYFVPGMPSGVNGDDLLRNTAFMTALRAELTERFIDLLSNAQINGNDYNPELCDSFSLFDKFKASADIIKVPTSVPITSTNVFAEFQRMLDRYPNNNRYTRRTDLQPKFAVSGNIASAYMAYLALNSTGFTVYNPTVGGSQIPDFQAIPMYVINALPANTMFLTYPRNIKMFGNTAPGVTEYIERDLSLYDIDDTVRIAIRTKTAVDFGRADEIVTYNI